jgi:HSP20 family molecular chaperone IbpA
MVTSYKRHNDEIKFAAGEILDTFVPFLDSVFFDTNSRRVNCFTDEGDFYGLELEMAGFGKKDVELEVSDGRYLVVKGSIKRGEKEHKVSERFQLPRGVNSSQIEAELKDGLLTVKIEKAGDSKPVTVKIS